MESFEELIAKEFFLKNIKRYYLTKIMESFNIEKISILYNNDIKYFEIKLNKDDNSYFLNIK